MSSTTHPKHFDLANITSAPDGVIEHVFNKLFCSVFANAAV